MAPQMYAPPHAAVGELPMVRRGLSVGSVEATMMGLDLHPVLNFDGEDQPNWRFLAEDGTGERANWVDPHHRSVGDGSHALKFSAEKLLAPLPDNEHL